MNSIIKSTQFNNAKLTYFAGYNASLFLILSFVAEKTGYAYLYFLNNLFYGTEVEFLPKSISNFKKNQYKFSKFSSIHWLIYAGNLLKSLYQKIVLFGLVQWILSSANEAQGMFVVFSCIAADKILSI